MPVNVVVKKNIRIDGKDYASLDDVPADKREAVAKAMTSISGTITVNGEIYAGAADLSPGLRGLVETALSAAKNAPIPEDSPIEPLPARPVLSTRTIVITVGIIALMSLIARLAF